MNSAQNIKSWFKVVIATAAIGSLFRFVFFILLAPIELKQFTLQTPYLEVFKSFFLGFRFDLSAACYLALVFWLISLFLSKKTSLVVWQILLTFWSFLLIIDIGYYSFYNDRINVLIFGFFEDDTWALIKTFWKNYPVLWIFLVTFGCYFVFGKILKNNFLSHYYIHNKNPQSISSFSTRLIIFVLLIMGCRGTFALFPLGDQDTVISSHPFLNTLSFGSAHAFQRALQLKKEQIDAGHLDWNVNLKEFGYLNKEDQAFEDFFQKKLSSSQNRFDLIHQSTVLNLKHKIQPHVVLTIMESWGYYGLQFQSKDFDLLGPMKKHFSEDLLNTNFLSATGATTGSLSCLLAGIPQRPISPFLPESTYLKTQLSTSPALQFKKQGYQTHFVYGGNPGWRDMNKFAQAQGFDFISGEVDIEKKLKSYNLNLSGKHDWGVFDEDLFKYIEIVLNESKTPQMFVVMTTTNHPPYELPASTPDYRFDLNLFPEKDLLIDKSLALSRFKTFRYSSEAFANFISNLKSSESLSANTILAATADHTFWIKNFKNSESFMKAAVPFYLYLPLQIKSQITDSQFTNFKNSFGSHQDIWPTLYNLSLSDSEYDSFGRSLFDDSSQSFALEWGRFIYTKNRAVFVQSAQDFTSFVPSKNHEYEPSTIKTSEDLKLATQYRALMAALDSYLYHSKIKP